MLRLITCFNLLFVYNLLAQQVADTSFVPSNTKMTFLEAERPIVFIDEAHHNFHTMDGRYQAFAKTLQSDGYIVKENTSKFTKESLRNAEILVISNALNERNVEVWDLPIFSAFQRDELEAVYHWVKEGGSLFLIADHMPFPKASGSLAAMFGFHFSNGFAKNENNKESIFSFPNGALIDHPIFKGMNHSEKIDSVRTFTGQAFLPPPDAHPLLVFGAGAIIYLPKKDWTFEEDTPVLSAKGWSQGAALEFHKGRVVVFGEAAMFTAQYHGEAKRWSGMKAPGAEQNEQLLLNVMHWLSKKI